MLVVELEPAPYKVDLWNAFVDTHQFDVYVLYSTAKNWEPDGGHDFRELPPERYASRVFYGKGIKSFVNASSSFLSLLIRWRPDVISVCGYVHSVTLLSIFACILCRRKYAVHGDKFNNNPSRNFTDFIKYGLRNLLRRLIFLTCEAILVSGRLGRESALVAGCSHNKIFDFPYVVNRERLQRDEPAQIPVACSEDLAARSAIILFSGRLIERKGLSTLIHALAPLGDSHNWALWIEGSGPQMVQNRKEVEKAGLEGHCRFLGFCQMSLHSWLLRQCDIVVVPSLSDSWGIVVDEGMQMGKAVITSTGTGSGADRVRNRENGLAFSAGDSEELSTLIRGLLAHPERRVELGSSAFNTARRFGPKVNAETMIRILQSA